MNDFYKRVIQETESQKEQDSKSNKRASPLLEIKDERTIPKLKVKFTGRRKWKRKKH